MNPLISIIIAVRNGEPYLPRALDSIANQTYQGPVEVILIDDGSTDQTAQIASAHSLSPRLLRNKKSEGAGAARNQGVQASKGPWLAFLDADDSWHQDKLRLQLQLAGDHDDPALLFTRYRRVALKEHGPSLPRKDHPAKSLDPPVLERLLRQNFIGTSTVLLRREAFLKAGGFPNLPKGQDYALWLRVASQNRLAFLPQILTYYGVHEGNRVGPSEREAAKAGLKALQDFQDWMTQDGDSILGKWDFWKARQRRRATLLGSALKSALR